MQIRVGTTVAQPGPDIDPVEPAGTEGRPTATRCTTRYITLNEIDVDEPTWFLNLNGVHFDRHRRRKPRRSARSRTGSTST